MTTWDEMVVVGRIARAHGNRGEVIVDPATDFPAERYKPGSVVHVRKSSGVIETLTMTDVRFHRGRPIVALDGVQTMNAAEALAGTELRIETGALQPLPARSFYHHDLVGCTVETPQGVNVGVVTGVEGSGTSSRLIVQGRSGEVQIPLADEIIDGVHLGARRIIVKPMDGLLDLNVTRKQIF